MERFFIYVENWKYFPRFIELVYSIKVNEHLSRFIAWATQSSNSGGVMAFANDTIDMAIENK